MTNLPSTRNITPRDYQIDAYQLCAEAIRQYTGPFYVEASVGAGKTIIMAMISARAQEANLPVLVLARRGELVEQNSETLWDCGVKNSIFSASVGPKSTNYPVIVGSEGTVARALDNELAEYAPMIILLDECHEFGYDNHECQYMQIIMEMLRRNPKCRIVGMTGSPYRGSEDITGEFWQRGIYRIRTPELVERGYLVPTFFGYDLQQQTGYDLHEWQTPEHDTHSDYSSKELQAMQRKITKDSSVTDQIMAEVVSITANRNAAMITGAGQKHLEQIAACLPPDSYIIITDKTGSRERREGLKAVDRGEKKYILQIGCLTTGYDEPLIDTSVIMRKIGSLTLLVQLLGRGMRLLKPKHAEAGITKSDHLVLDYSDTMAEMAEKYHNPILEKAQLDRSRKEHDLITCPACNTLNSKFARRCINKPETTQPSCDVGGRKNYSIDGRCEWFWQSRDCPGCKTPNDTTAMECRQCKQVLIDPNANLQGKHYTDDDFREVLAMNMRTTKSGDGLVVDYLIRAEPGEHDKTTEHHGETVVVATEILHPNRPERWAKGPWFAFLKAHLHKSWHPRVIGKPAPVIVKQKAIFGVPCAITHRTRQDGKSIIHRKRFLSGKEI